MSHVGDNQEPPKEVGSYSREPGLLMTIIRHGDSQGILKDAHGVCEIHLVLSQIGRGFLLDPTRSSQQKYVQMYTDVNAVIEVS